MNGVGMRELLADGIAAARIASDRAELWAPGGLAWVTTLGWVALVVVVVHVPGEADLAFFGTGLLTSSAWPWNAVGIGAGLVVAAAAAMTLGSFGQAALQAQLRRPPHGARLGEVARDAAGVLGARALASIPALVALAALAAAIVAVAPDEYQSPDIGGTVLVRIVGRVMPVIVLLAIAALISLALGAAIERRSIGPQRAPFATALRRGLADLRRAPGVAAVVLGTGLAIHLVYLGGVWLLLRVLWAPIEEQLATGIDPGAALLLVGFVAIWLCLILGGGALYAWVSAWWTLELPEGTR